MSDPSSNSRSNRVREALSRLYETQPPYFNEYLRRYREDPKSRVFAPLAEAYRRMGRVDDAIAICLEGLSHHPDFHGGRVALAKCYLDKRHFKEAKTELTRVVQVVPENLLAQRLLGDAWMALGEKSQALHCYKMSLLLSPNDVQLAEKVHRLERGESVFDTAPASGDLNASGAALLDEDPQPLWTPQPGVADAGRPTNTGPEIQLTSMDEEDGEAYTAEEDQDTRTEAVDALLLDTSESSRLPEEEAYQIEHVSSVFGAGQKQKREITTGTLGDLYFSQGQYDKALKIFEKLPPSPEVMRKVNACRANLGVDDATRLRQRQIVFLRSVLKKVRSA